MLSRRGAWAVLITGATADVVTTLVGIEVIGLSEANPSVAPLMASYGTLVMLPLTAVLLGWVLVMTGLMDKWIPQPHATRGVVAAVGLVGGFKVAVATWNSYLIGTTLAV